MDAYGVVKAVTRRVRDDRRGARTSAHDRGAEDGAGRARWGAGGSGSGREEDARWGGGGGSGPPAPPPYEDYPGARRYAAEAAFNIGGRPFLFIASGGASFIAISMSFEVVQLTLFFLF
jgi:hypothetical protein